MTKFLNGIVLLVISVAMLGCVTTVREQQTVLLKDVLIFSQIHQGNFQDLRLVNQPNQRLKVGNVVDTNANTIKTLSFDGATKITLMPNTRVKIALFGIELLPNQDIQSQLFIEHKSRQLFSAKTQYVTVMPAGTKYSIKAFQQDVSVDVFEGGTELFSNSRSWQPKLVNKHENASVRGENAPVTQPVTVAKMNKLIHPITQVVKVLVARSPTPKMTLSMPPPTPPQTKIDWLKFSDYKNCKPDECRVLKKYISPEFKEVYELIREGLTKVEPSATYTRRDFNNDGVIDFIVIIGSTYHCGSHGCETFMLLSDKKKYLNVDFPIAFEIGLNKSNELVFGTRKGCGFWRLDGKELIHIRNEPSCE